MCQLFEDHKHEIRQYCIENGLDFEKAQASPKCWGKNDIFLQYHDPEKGKLGLLDETPAPVTLIIMVNDGKISFEQTEYTKMYLAATE